MKKNFLFILRLSVTFSILFALFKFVPYKKLIEVYKDSYKIYIFLGVLIFFCCYLIGIYRWKFLLSFLGIKISYREAVYSYFSGLFFNLFFPSFVAGDVFRGFTISYRHGGAKKVASSVFMDRFSGAIALTLVALLSFITGRHILQQESIIISLSILCIVTFFSSLVIFSRSFFLFLIRVFRKGSWLHRELISFHDHLYFFKKNPQVFIKSLYFSLPIQVLVPLGFFVVAKAFNVNLSIIYFLILVPIITAIALIPITIAGAGTREASAVYFFSLVGIDKSIGLSISLLNLFFMLGISILGGIFYVSVYHRWIQSHSQSKSSKRV